MSNLDWLVKYCEANTQSFTSLLLIRSAKPTFWIEAYRWKAKMQLKGWQLASTVLCLISQLPYLKRKPHKTLTSSFSLEHCLLTSSQGAWALQSPLCATIFLTGCTSITPVSLWGWRTSLSNNLHSCFFTECTSVEISAGNTKLSSMPLTPTC